jgi:hypothetical protein
MDVSGAACARKGAETAPNAADALSEATRFLRVTSMMLLLRQM